MLKRSSCSALAPFGALVVLLGACTGTIESPASWDLDSAPTQGRGDLPLTPGIGAMGATGGNPSDVVSITSPLKCTTPAVGPNPLRRLTHAEYDNAVADLLGDTTHPARNFPVDTQSGLFDNTAESQTVPVLLADQYLDAAESLAKGIASVPTLLGCDPSGASGTTCVRGFIDRFGRRAYRRVLTSTESTRLQSLYNDTRSASDAETGVRAVVAAVLASPNFLFRPEFGTTGSTIAGTQRATQFELAARLASLLWASVPDDTLLDAAQAGQLATRAQVATQARRMLDDPRAHGAIEAFYAQWFGVEALDTTTKDTAIFPEFNDSLREAMREETKRFISNVLWDDDAKLSTLLTADFTFVNGPLAKLYGVKGPSGTDTFSQVALDPQERSGVVTQAAMLASFARPDESSPVKRGKWVRVRMLCQDLPDPPANVPQLPPLAANVSNRERFAMHTSNPACSGCHSLIDGLGFGLEAYDGIGRVRTMSQGVPVDSSGEVTETVDIDGPYEGGPELAARLASSTQVRDCAPTQWLRYAMGRHETVDDTCSLAAVREAFAASNGDLRELMVALTQTDAFWLYRQAK